MARMREGQGGYGFDLNQETLVIRGDGSFASAEIRGFSATPLAGNVLKTLILSDILTAQS
jgi:hypothetical protein